MIADVVHLLRQLSRGRAAMAEFKDLNRTGWPVGRRLLRTGTHFTLKGDDGEFANVEPLNPLASTSWIMNAFVGLE